MMVITAAMTVKDLRAIAREEGICLSYSGATKAGIVGEIASQRRYREHDGERGD